MRTVQVAALRERGVVWGNEEDMEKEKWEAGASPACTHSRGWAVQQQAWWAGGRAGGPGVGTTWCGEDREPKRRADGMGAEVWCMWRTCGARVFVNQGNLVPLMPTASGVL